MAHSDQRFIIGVDLGGTNIVVGAMPDDGTRHYGLRSQPTMAELGADVVVERIAQMIRDVMDVTMAETGVTRRPVTPRRATTRRPSHHPAAGPWP